VAFYGSAEWIFGKTDQKIIAAFETWYWRRMLKIKLSDKVRNEEEHRRIGEERILWSSIWRRRKRWARHEVKLMNVGNIMDEKIERKSPRGRARDKCLGQVKKDTGKKIHWEVKEVAGGKEEWRGTACQS
jgi:hypothetical protein